MALACPVFSAAPQSRAVLSFLSSANTTSESGGLREQSDRADRFSSISEPSLADSNVCISFDRITAYGTIGALVLLCCQLLKLKLYEPGRCLQQMTKMAPVCPVVCTTSQSRSVISCLLCFARKQSSAIWPLTPTFGIRRLAELTICLEALF